jgi:hypothetical protein
MTDPSHRPSPPPEPIPSAPPLDPTQLIALAQLWADQFQHVTTLAVAAAGGLLILPQTGLAKAEGQWWHAFALFILSAAVSFAGQTAVVDDATRGATPGRKARTMRALAALLLGAGGGAAFRVFTR